MRAVLPASATTGNIAINASELGIYGKSQGGEAAMSALQLAPSYAPDLEIDGGVILAPGFTPPIQGVLDAVASNPTSTSQNMFVLLIAQSFAENYPDLVDLDDILSPRAREDETACDHVWHRPGRPGVRCAAEPTAEHATGHRTRQRFERGDARHGATGDADRGRAGSGGRDDPSTVHACTGHEPMRSG